MAAATLTAKATDKCCDWCGIGDHYTNEVFEVNGEKVAHCHRGCEHPAAEFSAEDIASLAEYSSPMHHASACHKHHGGN
jgi:hypothetical protein